MVKLPGFSDVAHKPGQDHMSEQSARAERPKHWFLYLSRVFTTESCYSITSVKAWLAKAIGGQFFFIFILLLVKSQPRSSENPVAFDTFDALVNSSIKCHFILKYKLGSTAGKTCEKIQFVRHFYQNVRCFETLFREGFKNPSHGIRPLGWYPPPHHGRDFP